MSKFSVRKIRILSLMLTKAFEDESYETLDARTDDEISELFTEHCGSRTTAKAQLAAFEKRAGESFTKSEMKMASVKFKIKYKLADTQPEANLKEDSVRGQVLASLETLGVANKLEINEQYGKKCGNIIDTLVKQGYVEALPLSPEDEAAAAAEDAATAEAAEPAKPRRKLKRPANESAEG